MYRSIGAILIGCCTVYMGTSMSIRQKERLKAVTALRDSFLRMEQKISWYRLPLPVMLREISVEQADLFSAFYLKAADKLERNNRKSADRILMDCLKEAEGGILPESAKQSCRRLFSSFGQMDAEHQTQQLKRSVEELDRLEQQLQEDIRKKNRCFMALGVCGGLAITILLV